MGHSLSNPFSPYAAYMQLLYREAGVGRPIIKLWRECVQHGLVIVSHSVECVFGEGVALPSVDAFSCAMCSTRPIVRMSWPTRAVPPQAGRPATRVRVVRLSLPGQSAGESTSILCSFETCRMRTIPSVASSSRTGHGATEIRRASGAGFQCLSVFVSRSAHEACHGILSVTPDCGASLRGLAELLDRAESVRRREVFGEDDRAVDLVTAGSRSGRATRMPTRGTTDGHMGLRLWILRDRGRCWPQRISKGSS